MGRAVRSRADSVIPFPTHGRAMAEPVEAAADKVPGYGNEDGSEDAEKDTYQELVAGIFDDLWDVDCTIGGNLLCFKEAVRADSKVVMKSAGTISRPCADSQSYDTNQIRRCSGASSV